MIRRPESKLWQLIKKNTPDILWNRIETTTIMGFPDLIGCHKDCGLFSVELKVSKSGKIKLSPYQIAWNYSHALKGGRCFIIATPLEQTTLNIYGGIQARDLALNVQEPSLNVQEPLITFHKPFDWKGVTNFLVQEGRVGQH